MKRIICLIGILVIAMSLTACSGQGVSKIESNATSQNKTKIKAGTSILYEAPLKAAKEDFEKLSGYELDIIVFDDAVATNIALVEGDIDVNFYQHIPYLTAFNKNREANLKIYGEGLIASDYGLYSKKVSHISELRDGFTVSLPNDASNRGIALRFLADQGFIKLKGGLQFPTLIDIQENKRNIKFVEMDRLNLVTTLKEVDICAMPALYMFQSGEDPTSAIVSGFDPDELAIVIAVREENLDAKWAGHLKEALTNEKARKFIEETYKGAVIALY